MLDTHRTPLVSPFMDDNPHTKSYLRQICRSWNPATANEAKWFLEECLARAQDLTSVLMEYANENTTPIELVKRSFAVLDDLVYMANHVIITFPPVGNLLDLTRPYW
jgi:hypothetical protein